MTTDKMMARLKSQRAEFDSVAELAKQLRRCDMTPVVDDDYPAVRYDYERAVFAVIEAMRCNGRFEDCRVSTPDLFSHAKRNSL